MRFASVWVAALLVVGMQTAFAQDQPKVEEKPDIKEFVRIVSDPDACGMTDAVMLYKNSAGELKELKYKIMGNGCQGG